MTGADAYRAALARLQLPVAWQVEVAIRPRRRYIGVEVTPGGTVAVLIPPTTEPERVARFVGRNLGWITQNVNRAVRLAPDHGIKTFVDGDEFDLLGQRYRLQLVDTLPTGITELPDITDDHVLYARRQRPEQIRRAIIRLYRHTGLDWAWWESHQYDLQDTHIPGLRYEVRDLGRHRWGVYYGAPKHTIALHWAVFGLPIPLIEYVLAHEHAHATRPGGPSHGYAWQRQMYLWMPDWRQRESDLAETGRHCWLGDS